MTNITDKVMAAAINTRMISVEKTVANTTDKNTIDRVVLINTATDECGIIIKGEDSPSLRFIQEALSESGYKHVFLYPKTPINLFSVIFNGLERMVDELEAELKNDWNIVFGISVLTGTYWIFQNLAESIRKKFPFSTIVAGGPHFARETIVGSAGVRCYDSVEVALSETPKLSEISTLSGMPNLSKMLKSSKIPGLSELLKLLRVSEQSEIQQVGKAADFVVIGDAQPFIDFVLDHNGKYPANGGIKGMYKMSENGVVGYGKGSFPQVSFIPYSYDDHALNHGKKMRTVHVYFDEICKNACDYCSVSQLRKKIPQEIAVKSISSFLSDVNIAILNFTDSNPLEPRGINQYKTLIDTLKADISKTNPSLQIYTRFYLDPALLIDDNYFNELMKFFKDYNVIDLFIGRECVDEKVAEKIGRRFKGKIRTQEQLDHEREAIRKLLTKYGCSHNHPFLNRVSIAYIVTPFDTYESTMKMIEESKSFENMSNSYLSVIIPHFILAPNPGTKLRRLYSKYLREPESLSGDPTHTNMWSHELGPQVYFLEKLPLILAMPKESTNNKKSAERRKLFYDTLKEELDYAYRKHKPDSAVVSK